LKRSSHLEILFDPTNPGKRYWSIETLKGENGKTVPIWEYRVVLRNNSSSETLRVVRASVETLGSFPKRQEFALFEITKTPVMDLHPKDEKFIIVLRWWYPARQVGLFAGQSALEAYGPLKIVVNAEGKLPVIRTFQFDYDKEPMIFE
jgi:hypothetical protein